MSSEAQAGLARFGVLLWRQFAGEDGNEHERVDAQDDLAIEGADFI